MAEPKRLIDVQLELLNTELTHIDGAIRQADDIASRVRPGDGECLVTDPDDVDAAVREDAHAACGRA